MASDQTQKLLEGRVVAVHGRHYLVAAGEITFHSVTRGKKGGVACNDRVQIRPTAKAEAVIEQVLERRNLLYRSDEFRSKLLAANVDQVIIVTAAVPSPREELLNRCLIAAESAGVTAVILLNKVDLEESAVLRERLRYYEALGYPLLQLCAKQDIAPLSSWLTGKVSILVGASGVGKSTLVNALIPHAEAATSEVSEALNTGKHTTTHTRLYALECGGALIDSPGMQEFGLGHLDRADLVSALPEFRKLAGACRFHNCRHLQEPGCAVLAAVDRGEILRERWLTYRTLATEADRPSY